MRGRALLLGSVSSIATIAVAVSAAHAQSVNPGTNGYTFSVQGGALFSAPDSTLSQKAGEISSSSGFTGITSLNDLPMDIGYNAAFTLGKKLDGNWDMAFGASMNRLLENSGSFNFTETSGSGSGATSGSGFVSESTNFSFETGDFEVGYHPMVDNGLDVRLFGGIRGLHFNNGRETTEFVLISGSGSGGIESIDKTGQSDFLGAGPRIGISAAKRFDGSNFGISGSLAGAAIFGHQTDTFGGVLLESSGSGSPVNTSLASGATGTKLVTDVDASLGLDYYLNDASALTIGYHAENLTNVAPLNPSSINLPQASSRLVHGPFLKFTGSF